MQIQKCATLFCLLLAWAATAMSANVHAKNTKAAQIRPAPTCQLSEWGTGKAMDWQSMRGQVVYVDFWASWCTTCIQSFPFLETLGRELGNQGLTVVGINLDDEQADAAVFLTKYPVKFTIATDSAKSCPQAFGVEGMPAAYLIDRQGNIRYQHLGFRRDQAGEIRRQVEQLLNE